MLKDIDKYYIAVDGGGSKTEFIVYNPITKSEKHFFSGSTNYKNSDSNVEKNLIHDGIYRIFESMEIGPSQIKGLVMGLSGCDSKEDHNFFMNIADLTGITHDKIYIGNDCELAFFSEGKPPGLSIVAGTGSIATGIASDYSKARSGGWGSPVSDEGSGGWIGISIIKDLIRYCDGYGEYRDVFNAIRKHLGAGAFDALPNMLSQSNIKEIAGLAKLVMDEAEKNDAYCTNLVNKAAEYIAEISYSVYKKLNFDAEHSVDVVMVGSLFKSPLFSRAFKDSLKTMTLKNNLNFCGEILNPAMGGIVLARSLFG